MLDIYDLVLVVDLKREVYSFLTLKDLLTLQLVDTKFYESIENDEILWNLLSRRYFGDSLKRDEQEDRESSSSSSGRKRFVSKSRLCASTELRLINPIPEDIFSDDRLKERSCEIQVTSRNYPFKINLLRVEDMKSEHDESLPTSSLIFENYIPTGDGPLSEKDQKIIRTMHRFYAFLIFMSELTHTDGEGINFCDELLLNSGLGNAKPIFSEEEMRELDDDDNLSTQTVLLNKMIEKCISRITNNTFDFSNLETIFSSPKAEEIYQKHIRNPKSLIHSVLTDYQPLQNKIYGYWNFRDTKDPLKRLMTINLDRVFQDHPWFSIYSSLKKVFHLEFLKKPTFGLKKLKEKIKMIKFRKQVNINRSKKKIKMKWKTFFEPLEFRMLIQVGMKPNHGNSCNYREHGDSVMRNLYTLVYFSRRRLNDISSVIIQNSQNSQIVFNFCPNNSKKKKKTFFRVFDHAIHYNQSYTFSNISDTINMLRKERKEEFELENEWLEELHKKEIKDQEEEEESEQVNFDVSRPLLGFKNYLEDQKSELLYDLDVVNNNNKNKNSMNSMFDTSDEDADY